MILSLWEDLVSDAALMDQLHRVHTDFHLIDRSTFYWYPRERDQAGEPANALEALAELVIERVKPDRLTGVEYWSNSLAEGARMHPHVDKDEGLYWSSKSLRHPYISTVFYPGPEAFEGGELVIEQRHMISPAANQLVAFRGTSMHAVQTLKKGLRRSIALNLWDEVPMTYRSSEPAD